jgi:hypothetical protein
VHSWFLQISLNTAALLYLGHWRLTLHRRSKESWDELLSRLTAGWQYPVARKLSADSEDANGRAERLARLWELCRNACTLQQIADYALRNLDGPDPGPAEQLHCDATRLRFRALAALSLCALGRPVKSLE